MDLVVKKVGVAADDEGAAFRSDGPRRGGDDAARAGGNENFGVGVRVPFPAQREIRRSGFGGVHDADAVDLVLVDVRARRRRGESEREVPRGGRRDRNAAHLHFLGPRILPEQFAFRAGLEIADEDDLAGISGAGRVGGKKEVRGLSHGRSEIGAEPGRLKFFLGEQGLDRAGAGSGSESGEGGKVGGEIEALVEKGQGDLGSGPIAFRSLAGGLGGGLAQALAAHRGAAVHENDGAGQAGIFRRQAYGIQKGPAEGEG